MPVYNAYCSKLHVLLAILYRIYDLFYCFNTPTKYCINHEMLNISVQVKPIKHISLETNTIFLRIKSCLICHMMCTVTIYLC